jgi:hypothetical protein
MKESSKEKSSNSLILKKGNTIENKILLSPAHKIRNKKDQSNQGNKY